MTQPTNLSSPYPLSTSFQASARVPLSDIVNVDDTHPIPRALTVLDQLASSAVDGAIVRALPDMGEAACAHGIDVLTRRGDKQALAQLVGSFHDASPSVQSLIIGARRGLDRGFATALRSASFACRTSALEAIVAADAVELAHLLPGALRGDCPRTREIAAHALIALADSVLDRSDRGLEGDPSVRMKPVIDALGSAIHSWELHKRVDVLEAALRFGRHVVPAVQRKLLRRPVRIDRPLGDILFRSRDVHTVEFLWCALAMPALRASAVHAMESIRDPAMIRAVIAHEWLLKDPAIAAGFRSVRSCPWLLEPVRTPVALDGRDAACMVRLVAACGARHDVKLKRYEALLRDGTDAVRSALVWVLVDDRTVGAGRLLRELCMHASNDSADVARRELDRRDRLSSRSEFDLRAGRVPGMDEAHTSYNELDALFETFDRVSSAERRSQALTYEAQTGLLAVGLRQRLRGSDADARRRALVLIRELGWVDQFDEHVCHLAHDRDARTRSLAVSLLASLPGVTSSRILRSVVDDGDERVQANAVEAMDRLNLAGRLDLTLPKLDAPCNRVRANAVRSLLRMGVREARDILCTMLGERSARHRLSALWVVERSGRGEWSPRVCDMATSDPDDRVRTRAARACARWSGEVPDFDETHGGTSPEILSETTR